MIRTRRKSQPAPEGEAFDPMIFDVVHFRHYTQGNAEFEAELIGLFRGQLSSLLDQLGIAGSASDWKLAAHTLKGSARAIGAVAISDIAATLEELGFPGGAELRHSLLRLLRRAIADFIAETEKLIS
jgi:hypothetical protein